VSTCITNDTAKELFILSLVILCKTLVESYLDVVLFCYIFSSRTWRWPRTRASSQRSRRQCLLRKWFKNRRQHCWIRKWWARWYIWECCKR